ncbi:hypothetical protein Ddye_005960 [Dipteronia dyeriana]|uniref:Uncharacterized protein n=1 Tax=Dipteronia dyeriana TaxID=168575 RepID=A0AAE0CQ67_9ROSI|nr:hypothetical protein Ddye_005960 [Dipteronia dyeriana]
MHDWFKSGDCNSKFFHWKAFARKARNEIKGLLDDNGVLCNTKVGVESIVVNYFSGLFSSSNPSSDQWQCVIDAVLVKLSRRRSDFLNSPFAAIDVKQAVFEMFPTKALRIDRMSALF